MTESCPLIDTHLHLGGAISVEFISKLIYDNPQWGISWEFESIRNSMVCDDSLPPNFGAFLSKFHILDRIVWTEEYLANSIIDICRTIRESNVYGAILDFSINKYMLHMSWNECEAITFIRDVFDAYSHGTVKLILSLKYESPRDLQTRYADLIENPLVADAVCGIDVVGDECCFDSQFYKPLLYKWRYAGKLTRAHVGEFGPCSNIEAALKDIPLTNIAHGIKIIESPELMKRAIDSGIYFDLALTSNYKTGVVVGTHPVMQMIKDGLLLTIGSDDPIQLNTNLHSEYQMLHDMGAQIGEIEQIRSNAYGLFSNTAS